MNNSPARRRAIYAGPATLAIVSLAACTQMLDMDTVKAAIAGGIAEQVGLEVATVECPADREIKAGDVFECTATPAAGGSIAVQVTQDDDQGNITWSVTETSGLLDVSKVVAAVHDGILQQTGVDVLIDCGADMFRAAVAGGTFTCTATPPDGDSAMVNVEMVDAEGNINWSIGQQ